MTFTYDSATHKLDIASADVPVVASASSAPTGSMPQPWRGRPRCCLRESRVPGPRRSGELSYELVTAPEGGAALTDGAITGATLTPLTVVGDLPADVTMAHPNLNGYIA